MSGNLKVTQVNLVTHVAHINGLVFLIPTSVGISYTAFFLIRLLQE
jgi:hypothetical protein